MALKQIPSRQLDLGPAQYFEPYPEEPAGNQIKIRAGWVKNSNLLVYKAEQTTVAFVPVPTANHIRWDLVYIDLAGDVHTLAGTAQIQPVAIFTGAPVPPAYSYPLALVRVIEAGAVVVDSTDVTDVRPRLNMLEDRDYTDPHYVYPVGTYYKPALEGLSTEVNRLKSFLGKDNLLQSLPDYSLYTTHNFILPNDPIRVGVGKLDAALAARQHNSLPLAGLQGGDALNRWHGTADQGAAFAGPPGYPPTAPNPFATVSYVQSLLAGGPLTKAASGWMGGQGADWSSHISFTRHVNTDSGWAEGGSYSGDRGFIWAVAVGAYMGQVHAQATLWGGAYVSDWGWVTAYSYLVFNCHAQIFGQHMGAGFMVIGR